MIPSIFEIDFDRVKNCLSENTTQQRCGKTTAKILLMLSIALNHLSKMQPNEYCQFLFVGENKNYLVDLMSMMSNFLLDLGINETSQVFPTPHVIAVFSNKKTICFGFYSPEHLLNEVQRYTFKNITVDLTPQTYERYNNELTQIKICCIKP